jgi:hypothetical protein
MPIRGPDLLDFLRSLRFWPIRARRLLGSVFLGFVLLWTLLTFVSTYGEYRTMIAALRDGRCTVVEGQVIDFVPGQHSDRFEASFIGAGERFTWSDEIVTAGFHDTWTQGGPVHDGLCSRVAYRGGVILRLEFVE